MFLAVYSSIKMSSDKRIVPSKNDDAEEIDNVVEKELTEFLKFKPKNGKEEEKKPENGKEEEKKPAKATRKRKRINNEESFTLDMMLSIFLKIIYPLSSTINKFVVVGIDKLTDCNPVVIINQCGKSLTLSETAWFSLEKYMQLIDCYLTNNIFGKKTSFVLIDSNIEVDIVLFRGVLNVRIRDVTKHDVKVQLTPEEFLVMFRSSSAITHYISQLRIVEGLCKDYLEGTIDSHPTAPILYSPLDTAIINRLPQEVELYRRTIFATKPAVKEEEEEEEAIIDEDEEEEEVEKEMTDINSQLPEIH